MRHGLLSLSTIGIAGFSKGVRMMKKRVMLRISKKVRHIIDIL